MAESGAGEGERKAESASPKDHVWQSRRPMNGAKQFDVCTDCGTGREQMPSGHTNWAEYMDEWTHEPIVICKPNGRWLDPEGADR